jgi:predicted  nucleic acid-binding Zn-ribbon protein
MHSTIKPLRFVVAAMVLVVWQLSVIPLATTRVTALSQTELAPATSAVGGSLENQLEEVQKKLGDLRKQKQDIQGAIDAERSKQSGVNNEISSIARERDLLQAEVDEKDLVIQELNLQIEILTNTIADTEKVIVKTKADISDLEVEADKQLSSMYLDLKTYNTGISLIFADGSADIVKTGLYQKTIQDDTNNALKGLKQKNDELNAEITKLEESKVKIESDRKVLDDEKVALAAKKGELQTKISRLVALFNESQRSIDANRKARESLSDQEAKYLGEEELLKQQIFNRVGTINNGTFVKKGTIIGYQGLTGLTTGYHLHFGVMYNGGYQNPCSYLPSGRFGNCGGNGQIDWPLKGTFYYTSAYGYRPEFGSYHRAIDIAHPTQNAPVYAAHDGWYIRGFEPCNPSYWLCKSGGANYVILCQNKSNCNSGFKTMYWHLK